MSKEKKPEYHKAVMPFFFPLKDRENKEYDIYALMTSGQLVKFSPSLSVSQRFNNSFFYLTHNFEH